MVVEIVFSKFQKKTQKTNPKHFTEITFEIMVASDNHYHTQVSHGHSESVSQFVYRSICAYLDEFMI